MFHMDDLDVECMETVGESGTWVLGKLISGIVSVRHFSYNSCSRLKG